MYLVCGEALFDFFLEDDGDTGAMRFDARAGGSPFNVAIGISRLEGQSGLLTGISYDMLGQRLMKMLDTEAVVTDYLLRSERQTTLSLVGIDAAGQPAYIFYGQDSADCSVGREELPAIGPEITGFHFGSYSLVIQPVADALASLAAAAGRRFVSLDPNVRPTVEPDLDIWRERVTEYAKLADLMKISSEDLGALYPQLDPETKAVDWLDAGIRTVIVTDGGNEVKVWSHNGNSMRVTPPASRIVDTVGAGDSFQAALLARLAEYGDPKTVVAALDTERLRELLNFALKAAAITCSRRGANLPRRNEII